MNRSLRSRAALRFILLACLPWVPSAALVAAPLQAGAPGPTSGPVQGAPKGSPTAGAEEAGLAAFADVSADWGRGVEAAIERAYRECFRTLVVDGRIMTLRLPFAQNSERSELAEGDLAVSGGGKAEPRELWAGIEVLLSGADFAAYLAALGDGREKLILFDIPGASWSASQDRFAIERLRSGRYPGLPHKPAVLASGRGATAADVYNYIYCVGRSGIDCSGFVWHALRSVAAAGGLDLDRAVGRDVGLPRGAKPAPYVGTWFYDPRSGRTRTVADEPRSLLPGDILLFRGEDGSFIHSAVIQSVDLAAGRIRYLQSTDESPRDERGVHESLILFDPARPELSIKDPSVRWLQRRGVAFEGEPPPAFRDDGERYRAYAESGGGVAVRLKSLEKTAARLRAAAAAADAVKAPNAPNAP
ncbi:MAG: peptidoglycan endopeptidase [Spirochaetaceae bacterium]|nr:peptidoglycan endopeptidase [Spirochaetaceae bacterium]